MGQEGVRSRSSGGFASVSLPKSLGWATGQEEVRSRSSGGVASASVPKWLQWDMGQEGFGADPRVDLRRCRSPNR